MNIQVLRLFPTLLHSIWAIALLGVFSVHAASGPLAVLLPDGQSLSDPKVMAWKDAADEEGLRLTFVRDADFIASDGAAPNYSGVILPDQIHQHASDELITAIRNYVEAGGNLMLVYDAGALTSDGFYAVPKSRFSDLSGVDYVLYDELRDRTIGLGPLVGIEKQLWDLQVPPGKSMPFGATTSFTPTATYLMSGETDAGGLKRFDLERHRRSKHRRDTHDDADEDDRDRGDSTEAVTGPRVKHGSYRFSDEDDDHRSGDYRSTKREKLKKGPKSKKYARYDDDDHDRDDDDDDNERRTFGPRLPQRVAASTAPYAVTGYVYGFLDYPSFVTRGAYDGRVLLTSPDYGLAAGLREVGAGRVLFVNLPLSYLKGQTDGMLMHGFLRYFGADLLKMPRLADHPNGIGGLVLNWHVDSAEALAPMWELYRQGVWDHGPYSIHFTAGPDTIVPGDGLGLDVPNNKVTQAWIRYFGDRGHQVGSHGGWIHDYYGDNANETNQAEYQPYLELNKDAIEAVLGKPITEYSAPQGNNPLWAMDWLEANGIIGYYFTGHTGMGPTRTYRNGRLLNPGVLAFPVSTYDKYATFEEFSEFGVTDSQITRWLDALVDFSVANHTSRQIYFHPPGAVDYPGVMADLLRRTAAYSGAKQFRWYTMTELARFIQKRRQVVWSVDDDGLGQDRFTASHPTALSGQTWLLPRFAYQRPTVLSGSADIVSNDSYWVVSARKGKSLTFTAARQ